MVLANNSLSQTPLTGTAMVLITVLDINDEHPVFEEPLYSSILSELTPLGYSVLTVRAQDNDQPNVREINVSISNVTDLSLCRL